jgi:ADP-ribose pyrophosphatase YjhB (NUDIX family)
MRERLTARVLLFDAQGRILLMKGRVASQPDRPGEWFTVGGGVEAGETLEIAAAREIREESGIEDARVGPVVWRRNLILRLERDDPVVFREFYLVARCAGAEPRRDGWDAAERALIDDIRWWTLDELRATAEPVHPPGLAQMLPDIAAGRYPPTPTPL